MPRLNIDELSRGELRKLNALVKSVGPKLGEDVMVKWLIQQGEAGSSSSPPVDPVKELLAVSLEPLVGNPKLKLGRYGYTIKAGRGNGSGYLPLMIFKNGERPKPA